MFTIGNQMKVFRIIASLLNMFHFCSVILFTFLLPSQNSQVIYHFLRVLFQTELKVDFQFFLNPNTIILGHD
jgi:hypothetical protein